MAIIKAVNSRASIGNAINYITNKEKTEDKLISGVNCNPFSAIDEMKATKELWHKTEGRQYKHFIQSFPKEENISHELAHKMAYDLVKDRFEGHEILIATHKDRGHIHSHIIVNSVNYEDGHKLQWSKEDLAQMKERSDELCRENGLSICEKKHEVTTFSQKKYKALERATEGNYKSYVLETYKAVEVAKNVATSKDDFIRLMKDQGYKTEWKEKKKYITFQDMDGNKVRNKNLEKTFNESYSKEELLNEFRSNKERSQERNQRENRTVESRETGTGTIHTSGTGKRGTKTTTRELRNKFKDVRGISEQYNVQKSAERIRVYEQARREDEHKNRENDRIERTGQKDTQRTVRDISREFDFDL